MTFAQGGYIPGPPQPLGYLPSWECVIHRDGTCVRGDVDGHDPWNRPLAGQPPRFWICAKLDA